MRFITSRFTVSEFTGLPLTFLIVCFIGNVLLLDEIAESFENSAMMLSVDKTVAQFLFNIRITGLANALFYFSKMGTFPVVVLIAVAITTVLLLRRNFIYLFALLVALAGTGTTVLIGKNYFHRVRPEAFSFYFEPLYSFPSGHATVAVAFYGLLFYVLIRHVEKYKNKSLWMGVAILFVLLLGFSRLYLGVHYLSDVLAGFSLGLLWLLLAISLLEWRIYNKHGQQKLTMP